MNRQQTHRIKEQGIICESQLGEKKKKKKKKKNHI